MLTQERIELLYENRKFEVKKEENLLLTNEVQESNTLKKNINRDQYAIILMRKVNVRYGN